MLFCDLFLYTKCVGNVLFMSVIISIYHAFFLKKWNLLGCWLVKPYRFQVYSRKPPLHTLKFTNISQTHSHLI